MRNFSIAAAVLVTFSGAAHAQCTPEGNARFMATERRIQAAAARVRAGDCAAIAQWKAGMAAQRAILLRSQRQTYPYTCTVTFKNPSPPRCGGTGTAQAAAAKKRAETEPAAAAKSTGASAASCSDITGTGSKTSAAKNCNEANSAVVAARAAREQNPARAAQQYKRAADAYRRAGDTARADAILREAAGPVAVAAAPNPPGPPPASVPPPAAVPGTGAGLPPSVAPAAPVGAPRRAWSGEREDCDSAGYVDRQTAAWYNMCVPFDPEELEKSRPGAYKPPISPQDLTARAIDACRTVQWDAKRQCIFDAKLKRLLADDPNVRLECSSKAGQDQLDCVDAVFLYGPGASQDGRAERENLRRRLALMPTHVPDRSLQHAVPAQSEPRDRRCPPGQGMKPMRAPAFGAWSCQPLGLIWLAPNRPAPEAANPPAAGAANAPDPVQAFEERVNHVAAAAVVAATKTTGARLSAQDRETCTAAAFAAVHSILKGGEPPVPEQCRPMANASRVELAYYAGAHIDTISSPGVEELLSFLNARDPNSGVLNSGVIGPPRQNAATPDADCTQAESHWKAAEDLKLLEIYEDHLARFPTCNFATVAAARIRQLKKD